MSLNTHYLALLKPIVSIKVVSLPFAPNWDFITVQMQCYQTKGRKYLICEMMVTCSTFILETMPITVPQCQRGCL